MAAFVNSVGRHPTQSGTPRLGEADVRRLYLAVAGIRGDISGAFGIPAHSATVGFIVLKLAPPPPGSY